MAQIGQKVFFMALGFLAVILNDTPKDKQALRAAAIAGLIESFCMSAVPGEFYDKTATDVVDVHDHMAYTMTDIVEGGSDNHKNKTLLNEAMKALELCLEEDDMTFSSEQAAEKAVTAIKKLIS